MSSELGTEVKNRKHSEALEAVGKVLSVMIGDIPNLEWLQAISKGKSRLLMDVRAAHAAR